MRSLRRPVLAHLNTSSRPASTDSFFSTPVPYQPRPYSRGGANNDVAPIQRPPRPASSNFFTGKVTLNNELEKLSALRRDAQAALRKSLVYPLPPGLKMPPPAPARWSDRVQLKDLLGEMIRATEQRRLVLVLNELHRLAYLAELGGNPVLAGQITAELQRFSPSEVRTRREEKKLNTIDQYGRARGEGKRKTAAARVWIIPSKSATEYLDAPPKSQTATLDQPRWTESDKQLPSAEVRVNHLPLSQYFPKIKDRTAVLRPLKLTGLLGAFNVHAIARGGGNTGQAEAVALGLAKALVVYRPETKAVLYAGELRWGLVAVARDFGTMADCRWCAVEEPEDGREEEDQLAQGPKSGKPASRYAGELC